MKYLVIIGFRYKDNIYRMGDLVELDEVFAQNMLKRKCIVEFSDELFQSNDPKIKRALLFFNAKNPNHQAHKAKVSEPKETQPKIEENTKVEEKGTEIRKDKKSEHINETDAGESKQEQKPKRRGRKKKSEAFPLMEA